MIEIENCPNMAKQSELRKRVGANVVAADDGVSANRSSAGVYRTGSQEFVLR